VTTWGKTTGYEGMEWLVEERRGNKYQSYAKGLKRSSMQI
jgi:hypothetical protein